MPQDPPQDPYEEEIDAIVDQVEVLDPDFSDPRLLFAFIQDVAQKIHKPEVIAKRYGFSNVPHMVGFIADNLEIRKKIKTFRAIWESDGSLEERMKALVGHSLIESIPENAMILFDKAAPAQTKLDAIKTFARLAGMDGAGQNGKGAATGQQFVFNLMLGGKSRTFTTVVDPARTSDAAAIEGSAS